MNYRQLDEKKKAQIDILLENGLSMREVERRLHISHSTVSRYKNNVYQKRTIDICSKYRDFLDYLYRNYDWRNRSIEDVQEVSSTKALCICSAGITGLTMER